MKKFLVIIVIAIFGFSIPREIQSQTVQNLKANVIGGDKFDLYEKLDGGQSVFLDFWWIECYNCIIWMPYVEDLYQEYNKNKEELFVLGLNVVKNATNEDDDIVTFKDAAGYHYPEAGWENNTVNGANKFYGWWYDNVNPITNSTGFGQSILIIPDAGNSSNSKVQWYGLGAMGTTDYYEITTALLLNDARLIWESKKIGIEDNEWKSKIRVFPNPAHDVINIDLGDFSEEISVEIRDITGRLMDQSNFSGSGFIQIPTTNLNTGIYALSIISESGISTKNIQVY